MDLKEFVQDSVEFDPADIEANKVMSMLAYLLFFLPLVTCKDSAFGKFHANQGLILLIASVALSIVFNIVGAILPFIAWLLWPLVSLVSLAFVVYGMYFTNKGEARPLPLIGGFTILK